MLEAEIKEIIDDKRDHFEFDQAKTELCDYGKLIKKLIRIVLDVNNIFDDSQLKMDWKERGLLATNMDYLWR
jgi:hypothetical protein